MQWPRAVRRRIQDHDSPCLLIPCRPGEPCPQISHPIVASLALSAAVASTTIAIGVTAGSLLGWFRPAAILPEQDLPTLPEPSEAPSEPGPSTTPTQPVIFVPIAPDLPAAPEPAVAPEPVVQLALHEREHDADERAAEPAAQRHDDDDDDDDHRGRDGDHDDHDDEEDDDDD